MSDNAPLISILIPTYNQGLFIEKAVHSALSVSYPNLEVVVCDDNSSDDTFQKVLNIHSPSLRVYRNTSNYGRVANYRLLLNKYAKGKYVLMLDGDDWLSSTWFFQQAVSIMETNAGVSAVSGLTNLVSSSGIYETTVIPKKQYLVGRDLLCALPFHKSFLSHSATLYRRDRAINLSFYALNVRSSDWDSLYRLCHQGTIRYLDTPVSFWRLSSNNESLRYLHSEALANLSIWDRIYDTEGFSSPLSSALAFGAKNLCRARLVYHDIRLSYDQNGILASIKYVISVSKAYPFGILVMPVWLAIQLYSALLKYFQSIHL